MKILHVVPGLEDGANGCAVAAKLIARDTENAQIVDAKGYLAGAGEDAHEVWVHGTWNIAVWRACFKALDANKRLVRMPHGNLDPIRLRLKAFRKLIVKPIESYLFRRADRVVVTGEWEKAWCKEYGIEGNVEVVDLKRHFSFRPIENSERGKARRILYLGRRHPLKGVKYLESAVKALEEHGFTLREVSNHFGRELEADWEWCDVLCLPTLSENFGLVVAEALSRGKKVITTDGARAWENQEGVVYLKGFVAADERKRVDLLSEALRNMI